MCFLLFFFRFVLLLFSDVFFSFQVEEHLVCSLPRVALKIHFIKRHQERREETEANLFHSLSSSFFVVFFFHLFSGFVLCLQHISQSSSPTAPPFFQVAMEPIHTFSPSAENKTRRFWKKKPFMGSQSLLRVATRRLPFRWMTYSNRSHCQTTGTIRKASVSYQVLIIIDRYPKTDSVHAGLCVQRAQTSASPTVCCEIVLNQPERK